MMAYVSILVDDREGAEPTSVCTRCHRLHAEANYSIWLTAEAERCRSAHQAPSSWHEPAVDELAKARRQAGMCLYALFFSRMIC